MKCSVFVGIQIDILESTRTDRFSMVWMLADCLCYLGTIFIWFLFRKISAKKEEKVKTDK